MPRSINIPDPSAAAPELSVHVFTRAGSQYVALSYGREGGHSAERRVAVASAGVQTAVSALITALFADPVIRAQYTAAGFTLP